MKTILICTSTCRFRVVAFIIFMSIGLCAQYSPEHLAQAQLDAYNARDIEAFLVPYSDSVRVYTFPDKLLYQGKNRMRDNYIYMFSTYPDLNCKLVNRIVQGDTVIDQELVTRSKTIPKLEAIAIYKIRNEKIQEVYFIIEN
ncbi:MAG TPA: nuclear transport factor 2 family protein [Saprospiraceae bacterium]|nr:nuclear transport factor 2 family protein [Saprospiraceae bacterium]